jgi:ADP-dependent NAD(P)H-hydrate dehydratase / NAD(P)H-hydrate epimerase
MPVLTRLQQIQQFVVTADQMRRIEKRLFAAGMPIAALMEKVGGRLTERIRALYPQARRVGVLVGPGHNGGDALVVARELYLSGYEVMIHCPFSRMKELSEQHAHYCISLGIPTVDRALLQTCDLLIDGLFGFGIERPLAGEVAAVVHQVNHSSQPIVSIDLPSGLHSDTGERLGTAIRATHTLCLGLWKQGLLQDPALEWVGTAELVDFDLPIADIQAVLGESPAVQRTTPENAIALLPLQRPATTHKYKMGHLLLVCGSRRYAGGAILTGLGARASGVGMVSIAAPAALKPILTAQLPEALVIDCPETESGAIAQLPASIDLADYDAIACGPGLTLEAAPVVQQVLQSDRPLVLDADGLNVLAQIGPMPSLQARSTATILTPHWGEFQRLFPDLSDKTDRVAATRAAAEVSGAVVLLKGARVTIANAAGEVRLNPRSTAALARGGSGDVLTGLMGGLLAQAIGGASSVASIGVAQAAAWWHAEAGILALQERTILGVDAFTLTQYLTPALQSHL